MVLVQPRSPETYLLKQQQRRMVLAHPRAASTYLLLQQHGSDPNSLNLLAKAATLSYDQGPSAPSCNGDTYAYSDSTAGPSNSKPNCANLWEDEAAPSSINEECRNHGIELKVTFKRGLKDVKRYVFLNSSNWLKMFRSYVHWGSFLILGVWFVAVSVKVATKIALWEFLWKQ